LDKTRLGSAGKIVDTMEVKIDSPDPYNEVGEIMVRGENVMLGYFKTRKPPGRPSTRKAGCIPATLA
jgi:long-chain acyl-CoA synthetase